MRKSEAIAKVFSFGVSKTSGLCFAALFTFALAPALSAAPLARTFGENDIAPAAPAVAPDAVAREANEAFGVLLSEMADEGRLDGPRRAALIKTLSAQKKPSSRQALRLGWLISHGDSEKECKAAIRYFDRVQRDVDAPEALRDFAGILRYQTAERGDLIQKLNALKDMETSLTQERNKK